MKRTPLIFLIGCVVGVSPLAPLQAKQQCIAEAPANLEAHWYYRIIDDRKCWYQGKPMLSRSLLEWPATTPGPAVAEKAPVSAPSEMDGFEAQWRNRFLDAMGKY
jgi:hypothetical protein